MNLLHRKIKSVFPNLREFNLHLHSMIDGMIDGSRLSDERFAITQTSRRKKDVASSRYTTTGTALSESHVSWGIHGKWWADGQFEGRIPMKFNPNKYKGVNKEGMKRQFEQTQDTLLSAPRLGIRSVVNHQNI